MNKSIIPEQLQDTATEWLVYLQSDNLTEQDEQAFYQWLQADPAHQRAYIEAERFWHSLSVLEAQPAATPIPEVRPTARRDARSFIPTAIAACVAFVLISVIALTQLLVPGDQYTTAIGEQRRIVLADGTRLTLNTDTKIRAHLDQQRRLIHLERGEAFFDVAKETSRPFIVRTPTALIRVLGTRFSVLNTKDSSSLVTVVEGRVGLAADRDIAQAADATFAPVATLVANQQAHITAQQQTVIPADVDAGALTAWRDGTLIYNSEPIARVLEDISRYFDGEIRLGEPALANTEVVAIFQLQDKENTLKALEEAFHVAAVKVSDDLTLIYPKK